MGRPDVNIVCQYGPEVTAGVPVAAVKRLSSMGIEFGDAGTSGFFRVAGNKYPTVGVRHRAWSTGRLYGIGDYNHVQLAFSLLVGHGTITTPFAGVYSWPFAPNTSTADSPKTATVACGDSTAAQKVAHAQATGLTVSYNEDSIDVEAPIIARAIDNAASLDAVTSTLAEAPMSVADINWYIDPTYGAVGTTAWARVKSGTFTIPDRVAPTFNQNTTQTSFAELIEGAVEAAELRIVTEYDSQSRALYDALNVDSLPVRYVQTKVQGDPLGGGNNQLFKTNYAVKLIPEATAPRRGIAGGVYGYEFAFRVIHDPTMGRAWEATIVNNVATF